jgi:hypothetical protein
MAEVLTTKLKNDTLRLFYDDIANNEFYFAVSSIALDELSTVDAVNSQYSKNEFKENILFGKKVLNSDIKYMIKFYPWQKDAVYTQYDDKVDLDGTNFYAVVEPNNNDSGDYRVYKCLNNNNGAPSTTPPNYNAETNEQLYLMPDGYLWKFMYYLTEQEFEAYNAVGFIPLTGSFDVNPANTAITGSPVSSIFVENFIDNNGYTHIDSAAVFGPAQNDGTVVVTAEGLSEISNYYSGMTAYITISGTEESFAYEIDTYTFEQGTGRGRFKLEGDPLTDGIINGSSVRILPTIKISGDGSGCTAIPNCDDGQIKTIEVINTGSNYNNIEATVVDPLFDFNPDDRGSIDIRAELRPILAPKGGHNYNLIDELHCRHVLLYGYITEADNNQVGKSNTYSAVGLLKNPTFTPDPANTQITDSPTIFDNRIEVITNDYGKVVVNSIVKQVDVDNNTVFEGRVHEIRASSNSVFLCSYMGPYVNAANNDIALDTTKDLINSTGQRLKINTPVANNIIESRYTQRSGTVYFMEDFVPLTRTETSREEYKLVLEI